MPRLSWNEIEARATQFAARWEGETYEKGESQSLWSEFLTVFGIDRLYHRKPFESEPDRDAPLFKRYQALASLS
jgi:hypothetical protein